MRIYRLRKAIGLMALTGAILMIPPANAETIAELDQLSDASADEQAGMQLARDQAARGELLEALATLERVLAVASKAHDARLMQAYYLCKIDDIRGGKVALSKLKKKRYEKADLNRVYAQCGIDEGG